MMLIFAAFVGCSNLFVYCFFGKMATESFMNIADSFYESNWQSLPNETQKYFIVIIANAQKPIYYYGFGIAILNLESFCSVR